MSFANQSTYHIRPARFSDLQHLPDIERSAGALFLQDLSTAPLAKDEPKSVEKHVSLLAQWNELSLEAGGTWVAVAVGDKGKEDVVGFIATRLVPIIRQRQKQCSTLTETGQDEVGCATNSAHITNVATGTKHFSIYIEELSVHVDHQRKLLASRLVREVQNCARRLSKFQEPLKVVAVTLTTFRDVPFNAPFYRQCGFHEIPFLDEGLVEDVVGIEGTAIWDGDQAHFASVGDGGLRHRRCYMVCGISLDQA